MCMRGGGRTNHIGKVRVCSVPAATSPPAARQPRSVRLAATINAQHGSTSTPRGHQSVRTSASRSPRHAIRRPVLGCSSCGWRVGAGPVPPWAAPEGLLSRGAFPPAGP